MFLIALMNEHIGNTVLMCVVKVVSPIGYPEVQKC